MSSSTKYKQLMRQAKVRTHFTSLGNNSLTLYRLSYHESSLQESEQGKNGLVSLWEVKLNIAFVVIFLLVKIFDEDDFGIL